MILNRRRRVERDVNTPYSSQIQRTLIVEDHANTALHHYLITSVGPFSSIYDKPTTPDDARVPWRIRKTSHQVASVNS